MNTPWIRRNDLAIEQAPPCWRRAFTLVEMMVSIGLAGLLIGGVISTYLQHRHSLHAQRLLLDIQNNLRTAALIVSRDLALTGYGLRIPDSQLAQWINWAGTMNRNPRITTGDNGNELTIASAARRVAELALPVTGGSSTITVANGGDADFNTSDRRLIYIGRCELARIRSIAGNILTISTHPTLNEPLRHDHANGAPIELVQVISYWVDDSEAFPVLRRLDHAQQNGPWFASVIATGIEHFEATQAPNHGNLITFLLRGRAQTVDHRWTDPDFGDGFRRLTLSTQVFLRNREGI